MVTKICPPFRFRYMVALVSLAGSAVPLCNAIWALRELATPASAKQGECLRPSPPFQTCKCRFSAFLQRPASCAKRKIAQVNLAIFLFAQSENRA